MARAWLGDLEQRTAPPQPLLCTNKPLSLSFPVSKIHGGRSESWMMSESPSGRTSQGPVTHGLPHSLPPGRSVSLETTLVPLPPHLEPHLSPKGKVTLKISLPIGGQRVRTGGFAIAGGRKGQNRGRCWFLWTQKCYSHSRRHLSQPGRRQLAAFASLTYLFERLQPRASFKCCSKIRTYKVSEPGSKVSKRGVSLEAI